MTILTDAIIHVVNHVTAPTKWPSDYVKSPSGEEEYTESCIKTF